MFNNSNKTSDGNTTLSINAISGTIVKNYKDSFFKRFHLNSSFAEDIFDVKNPHICVEYSEKPVVVLQAMLCGNMEVLCELIWKDDFEKLSNREVEE